MNIIEYEFGKIDVGDHAVVFEVTVRFTVRASVRLRVGIWVGLEFDATPTHNAV